MRFRDFLLPVVLSVAFPAVAQTAQAPHPLTIDDVLDTQRVERARLSPDGAWVAVVISRPARPGEVYGRTSYEVDSARNDVWLISTKTGKRRALIDGARQAAGSWCPTWSPDGQRLAMLSTAPQGREPRGGNAVRLYVWERRSDTVRRLDDGSVMAQSRYGSPVDVADLRGGADRSTVPHRCVAASVVKENAPFLWLDNHRLLVAMLTRGEAAAAVDHFARVARTTAQDAAILRAGTVSTASTVASGAARSATDAVPTRATLRIVDTVTRSTRTVADVPAYPFDGALTAAVSPDGRQLAVLATLGALRPQAGRTFPNSFDSTWLTERRLGFVDLTAPGAIRWAAQPPAARYPLDLLEWSPDSRSIAYRARADAFASETPLFVADRVDGTVLQFGPASVGDARVGPEYPHPVTALWLNRDDILARTSAGGWRVFGRSGLDRPVAAGTTGVPDGFVRASDGSVIGLTKRTLVRVDTDARLVTVRQFDHDASLAPPEDSGQPQRQRLLYANAGWWGLQTIDTVTGTAGPIVKPPPTRPDDINLATGQAISVDVGRTATTVRLSTLDPSTTRDLLVLNTGLRNVVWGEKRLIDYRSTNGQALKAAVILPPGYESGKRYPTLVWVYGGRMIYGVDGNFVTDETMPGFYNLQLYAARGYVVLVPSMPLPQIDGRNETYRQIPSGVLPAIDALIAQGIADPERLGVFGQSFGGYSVYALLSQTNRFKAGVAIAGITDLRSNFGSFDPTARGYSGIAHQKSANWAMPHGTDAALPWQAADAYARNSPIAHVDKVQTPLLMLHGENDIRGAPAQAEQFFYSLYRQGKTAELVRYGGESHSIALSPANVRDVLERTVAWFDRYVRGEVPR